MRVTFDRGVIVGWVALSYTILLEEVLAEKSKAKNMADFGHC